VLALIDGKGASSRLMLLIRGSNSFAYRGLYAVDVRSADVDSGSNLELGDRICDVCACSCVQCVSPDLQTSQRKRCRDPWWECGCMLTQVAHDL